jgi:acyl-CoA synthetase (AMP-forming)/AMP-acid ligase II
LALVLDLAADAMGDRVAIGDRRDGLTYAALRELARAAAPDIAARARGTLVFAGANGPPMPAALFAANWAGVSFAPINYRLPKAQQEQLTDRLDSGYLVEADGDDAWLARLRALPGNASPYVEEPDRPAVLLFTSGTSSEPKAAVVDHDNLLAYILNAGEFMAADEDEAVLMSVPPFHIAGVAGVLSATYAGRRIVPLPRFGPDVWVDAVRRESVTHAFLVPTMLARIVAFLDGAGAIELPSLRTLSYGGARMPAPVLERALELLPNAGFVNAYGLTETSSTIALLGPDDHREAMAGDRRRLASVGRPLPGVEVDVVDDSGQPVGAGVEGRIRVRGAQVSGRYVGIEESVDDGGWLMTGDLGRVDDEGYLYVMGRADDLIIAGGENVSPAEIEDCLLRHPAITAAAVVGVPHDEWGEQVAAMVTVRVPIDGEELMAWVREQLGGLKAPKRIEIRTELPMTPTGKLLRREVRAELSG